MSELSIYNSFSREKEKFESITPGHVGMYVCGPTVNGESHLGHARPYVTFDVVHRYLKHLGYRVRYVRNITDAGHFEEEGRTDSDRIGQKAQLEKLEPMELVHKYTNIFHHCMRLFNNLEPAIEPTATGHIVEQIGMIEKIISEGYAYEVNGSVYFDVKKYAQHHPYGKLSGRVIEELLETTRDLEGQDEKKNKVDFALWKKAPPQHIQRWQSPWGEGFPGWHIECSAMSAKYLGETFDIHGGGMDLQFPHHESEIAQSTVAHGHPPVRYWMHNNMITINGKKMGRSYNNIIKLTEMFSGNHDLLEQPYHPMVVRFYILQTHYRSTLDFSNEALQASEKALRRLWEAYENLNKLQFHVNLFSSIHKEGEKDQIGGNDLSSFSNDQRERINIGLIKFESHLLRKSSIMNELVLPNNNPIKIVEDFFYDESPLVFLGIDRSIIYSDFKSSSQYSLIKNFFITAAVSPLFRERLKLSFDISKLCEECGEFMNDDFNTAKVIANLFELAPIINSIKGGQISADALSQETLELLKQTFKTYLEDILGLQPLQVEQSDKLDKIMSVLIDIRKEARTRKDWATSDHIRNKLAEAGIMLKDEKDGSMSYTIE